MPRRKTLKLSASVSKTKEQIKKDYIYGSNAEKSAVETPNATPNTAIMHPDTGAKSFGYIPEIQFRGEIIRGGEIELRQGKHKGPHSGFGIEHIWAEHSKEMAQEGFHAKHDVPRYVAAIIRKGTPVHYAGENTKNTRVTVLRSKIGTAVLELRQYNDFNIWSVVTAYGRKNANGPRVGAVE